MKFIIFFLLVASCSYGQGAFTDAQQLSDAAAGSLVKAIDNLRATEGYDASPNKTEIENFYKFLKDPFDPNLQPVNVGHAIQIIDVTRVQLAVAIAIKKGIQFDADGDSVPDSMDLCPDVKGTLENRGCPEAIDSTKAMALIPSGQDMTTVLVDALAKFLVDRVKQELTITFFENFREKLNTKITVNFTVEGSSVTFDMEMKNLFQNTFLLLDGKDYFDTPSLGKTWVTAFKKDLVSLPAQLETLIRSNAAFSATGLGTFALVSFDIVAQAKRGDHPMRIINNINTTYNQGNTYNNESRQALGLLNLLSSNLTREVEQGGIKTVQWVSREDLQKLDSSSRKYLIGLLYQQGRQSTLFDKITKNGVSLTKSITLANYTVFYQRVTQVSEGFTTVLQLLHKVKSDIEAKPTEETLQAYAGYLTALYGLLDETVKMRYDLLGDSTFYTSAYYTKVRPIGTAIAEFNSAIVQKNYAETILLSVSLLKQVCDGNNNEAIRAFTYYSNFLADIIAASESGSSDDVKKIIENYAMPVGSYRLKRMYSHSWDVNAFPGLYFGYEFSGSNSLAYGITAPVGIAYSRKHRRSATTSSSTTLFLSVIDIGAPFSYRFENDEAEGLPEAIKWEQIFSPGIFYIYGFNNTPITLSIGGQFTPLLRNIEKGGNLTDEKNVFRISLGLMVDVPIFNLKKGKLH